jgi:predicted MFS family arabinose efflux permease
LCGAGVANIASGIIADNFGYRIPFYLTVLSCLVNVAVMLSLKEPAFHKPENKEKILRQLLKTSKAVLVIPLLRILAIIMSLYAVVELFKADFGQLYFLRYVTEPQLLGLLWAVYAFTWAIGGFIAHRLHNRLNELVIGATLPVLLMGFIDSWPALVLFNVQAVASAALMNQIETRVQDETPSHVRASIISVLSSIGRAVTIPASLALGWIFKNQGAFVAVRAMSILATCILIIWIFYQYSSKKKAVI